MHVGVPVPKVTFKTRVRDESVGGSNPFRWQGMTTDDDFKGKRVVLFSLPGAFTPTCSTYQLPGYEKGAQDFYDRGIDEIYCMSVNDSFVMNKWAQGQELENDGVIAAWFEEPGQADNHPEDPYGESAPETVLAYLKNPQSTVTAAE